MFYIIGVNPNIERADGSIMEQIWIEKYRPNNLSEVVGQEAVTTRLKNYVKESSMPHLLFAGPAGIGKTTSALALAREMFGELWKHNLHELNASDERGIDVVRGKIKEFARTAPLGETGFKIIFLDEADALTGAAQAALRRTMEKYSRTCRFVMSCNFSSKIIDPIQSRCAVFRFRPIKAEDLEKYLKTNTNDITKNRATITNLTDDVATSIRNSDKSDERISENSRDIRRNLDGILTSNALVQKNENRINILDSMIQTLKGMSSGEAGGSGNVESEEGSGNVESEEGSGNVESE